MARTPVLSQEQILDAAFNLLNEDGPDAITIRSIAGKLGKSTAPIYTQYANREAIMDDLLLHTKKMLYQSTDTKRTVDGFLNIGLGILEFALDNKQVFSYFFITNDKAAFDYRVNEEKFLKQMKSNELLSLIGEERLHCLLDDMWVYTYGLATMICNGIEKDESMDYYKDKLQQMGHRLISYHLYSSGQYETYVQTFMKKVSQHIQLEEVFKP